MINNNDLKIFNLLEYRMNRDARAYLPVDVIPPALPTTESPLSLRAYIEHPHTNFKQISPQYPRSSITRPFMQKNPPNPNFSLRVIPVKMNALNTEMDPTKYLEETGTQRTIIPEAPNKASEAAQKRGGVAKKRSKFE